MLGSVPVKSIGHRTARHSCPNDIGSVGSLLCVNHEAIIDWCIGSDNDRTGRHYSASFGLNASVRATFDLCGMSGCEDSTGTPLYGPGQPGEVFQWVELALPGEA